MFAVRRPKIEEEEKKDVFAPVADLMVGVVFIFLVMILALSLVMMEDAVPRPDYDQVVRELTETRAKLDVAQKRSDQLVDFVSYLKTQGVIPLLDRLAEADATRAKILQTLKDRLDAQGVKVEADFRSGVLRLPTGNLFESAQADPTPYGRDVIRILGQTLADTVPCFIPGEARPVNCPQLAPGSVLNAVYIEGHTDFAPIRSAGEQFRDNWELSAARSIAAWRIVRESDARIPNLKIADGKSLIGVSGYADTRPLSRG